MLPNSEHHIHATLAWLDSSAASLRAQADQLRQQAQLLCDQADHCEQAADRKLAIRQSLKRECREAVEAAPVVDDISAQGAEPDAGDEVPAAPEPETGPEGESAVGIDDRRLSLAERLRRFAAEHPARLFSAADFQQRLGADRKPVENAVYGLVVTGELRRVVKGRYRWAGQNGRARESASCVRWQAPPEVAPGSVRERVLRQMRFSSDRAWRVPAMAEVLGIARVNTVRSTMTRMLAYGELVKDTDGQYRLRTPEPDFVASQEPRHEETGGTPIADAS